MTKAEMETEMLNDMLDLQAELDKTILKESGTSYAELLRTRAYEQAILDELGELNHELKADWCWWKKSQKPVDRQRVLEEFVDVLHFCLSQTVAECSLLANSQEYREATVNDCILYIHAPGADLDILDWRSSVLRPLTKAVRLMKWLGFNLAEVYEAYKQKNAVNHQRQQEGY